MNYWIGLDIGGTKIAAQMVDDTGKVVWQIKAPTAKGKGLYPAVCALIDQALMHIDPKIDSLNGIGIGIPGKVVPETGEIHLAVNLNIETPFPIGSLLSERYSTVVNIENDVRLGAIGVQQLLNKDDVAYISIGTGLAAGFVLNGQLYRGKNGLAGEIGHVLETFEDGTPAILETIVSGPAILRRAQAADCDVSNPADVFELADSGFGPAKRIINHFFHHLARALQWVALTFDIDHIVLGGGVTQASESFEDYLRCAVAQLREQSKVANLLLTDDKITILPKLHNPGLWGATYIARNRPS
ncbi:MAG: glucokinase [Candidatus Promineifilaceae bacterium]